MRLGAKVPLGRYGPAMDFIQAQDKDRVEAVDIEDADRLENAMAI